MDAKQDTILFAWSAFFCVNKYSERDYPDILIVSSRDNNHKYQVIPLLDESDNDRYPSAYEAGFHCQNPDLKRYYDIKEIEELKKRVIIRKINVYKHKKRVIIEDLIPYKGHCISMIYVRRKLKGAIEGFHTFKGGNIFYDPTTPTNMIQRCA